MHDLQDQRNSLNIAKKLSPEVFGRQCAGCKRDLDWQFYRRDSSMRDGHAVLCADCESSPVMTTAEHTAALREKNYNSEATKAQRWENQDEYRCDEARIGRPMAHTEFLSVVRQLVPSLYVTEGRIIGHLSIFRTYPCPQTRLEGRDFEYLFYCPMGVLPEYSIIEFNHLDVPVRETKRGWRTILLRLIKARLLNEETANKVFGRPEGIASAAYNRQLKQARSI